jgi:hypothetical protein
VKVKFVELIFGWRLIVLIDLATLIPLAIKIVQIQEHEAPYLLELVRQMLMVAVATAYRLWDKAQSGATHQAADHQISHTVHRILATDTGELTEVPVVADPVPTHLASAIASPPRDETGDETTADKKSDFLAHSLLNGQGTHRWRRQLQRENRDKVIVFIGNQYGIFDTHEFLILSGVPLRALPPHLGSREDVLRRYDCDASAAKEACALDT